MLENTACSATGPEFPDIAREGSKRLLAATAQCVNDTNVVWKRYVVVTLLLIPWEDKPTRSWLQLRRNKRETSIATSATERKRATHADTASHVIRSRMDTETSDW